MCVCVRNFVVSKHKWNVKLTPKYIRYLIVCYGSKLDLNGECTPIIWVKLKKMVSSMAQKYMYIQKSNRVFMTNDSLD